MLYPFIIVGVVLSAAVCVFCCNAVWFLPLFLAFYALSLVLFFAVLFIISLFTDKTAPQEGSSGFHRAMLDFTVSLILKLLNTKTEITGKEKLPEKGPFLIVGNHISNYDPIAVLALFKKYRISYITKPENLKIPIAGGFIYKCCFLPIDRENDRAALKTILNAAGLMKKNVCSIGVYPEGTRNKSGKGLLPFKNGCFKIAQRAGVPIVVVTTKNTNKIAKNAPFRRTNVHINVCGVISAEEAKGITTVQIGEKVKNMILKELKEKD